MAKNRQLMEKYGVRGYPTIVIVDGSGKALGRTGYLKGGPAAMKAQLNKYTRKVGPPPPPKKAPQPPRGRR